MMMKKVEVNIMFYQFPNNGDLISTIDYENIESNDLKQYCKSEHVMPSSLILATKTKGTIKLRIELSTCHLLQRINAWLSIIINRLTADIEQSGKVHKLT
jgi:hypothetical protein